MSMKDKNLDLQFFMFRESKKITKEIPYKRDHVWGCLEGQERIYVVSSLCHENTTKAPEPNKNIAWEPK